MRVSLVGRRTSYVMCLLVVIDACVFGGRLARLAALASRGALLALWTSSDMCLLVVIDACVFGGAPREARCARLARRPACVADFTCYVSACGY